MVGGCDCYCVMYGFARLVLVGLFVHCTVLVGLRYVARLCGFACFFVLFVGRALFAFVCARLS